MEQVSLICEAFKDNAVPLIIAKQPVVCYGIPDYALDIWTHIDSLMLNALRILKNAVP